MIRWCFALIVAMVFCSAAVRAADKPVWHHGIIALKSDAGFVLMADAQGFAARQGLTLDLVQFKSDGLALKALLAGDLDSYEGSPGAPMLAFAHGADVRIVGCHWPVLTYGFFATKSLTSLADVKGHTIGISTPGSLVDLLTRAVLEKYGIADSEVHFAMLGSDVDRFRALSAGVVDVAAMSTELAPLAQAQGISLLLRSGDAVPDFVRSCIQMSGRTLAKRGDDAVRFLTAEMQGLRFALEHRDAAIALTRQAIGAKPDDPRPAYVFDENAGQKAIDPTLGLPLDKLGWMQALLLRTGNLDKPFPLTALIDPSFREKALARAGD